MRNVLSQLVPNKKFHKLGKNMEELSNTSCLYCHGSFAVDVVCVNFIKEEKDLSNLRNSFYHLSIPTVPNNKK